MKVYENSLHAKLYKFTYSSNLPTNLCPYFWKLVFGFLVFIPNFLLQLPALIYNLFKREYDDDCGDNRSTGFAFWIVVLILYLYGRITYNMILAFMNYNPYDLKWASAGMVINIAIIVIAMWFVSKKLYENYKYKKTVAKGGVYAEDEPSIIEEFIKAKYNKYCPKLEWKENNLQNSNGKEK